MPHERLSRGGGDGFTIARITAPAHRPVSIDLPDGQEALPFDHQAIVDDAVLTLQADYDLGLQGWGRPWPDPAELVSRSPFTLTDLRLVYEAVHGQPIQRDSFARRFDPRFGDPILQQADGLRTTGGRPARLFEKYESTYPRARREERP